MSERSAVQNPMLKYAEQIGWEYIRPEDARGFPKRGYRSVFQWHPRSAACPAESRHRGLSRTGDILRRLNLLKPTIEGNREAHSWLRGEQSVFVPEEKRERNITSDRFRPSRKQSVSM